MDTTRGETIPDGKRAMHATTEEDVAQLRRLTAEEMSGCVVMHGDLTENGESMSGANAITETAIIGQASPEENLGAGAMTWPHGFHLRYMTFEPGARSHTLVRHEEEVIFVHAGSLAVHLPDQDVDLGPGDTLTVPIGMKRSFSNPGDSVAETYVVRGGDSPSAAEVIDD